MVPIGTGQRISEVAPSPGRMRILHVTDLYPPFIGGMEQHVHRLCVESVARGHDVAVATAMVPGTQPIESISGVEVHRLPEWSAHVPGALERQSAPFHPPFLDPGFARGLAGLARSFMPDVIHGHGWSMYSTLRASVARIAPIVMTLHDYGAACVRKNMLYMNESICTGPKFRKCLRCAPGQYGVAKGAALTTGLFASRPMHRNAEMFVGVSQFVLTTMASVIPDEVPTEVIPPFLAEVDLDPERPDWLPAGRYVMFVGALGVHKGIDVLMQAWNSIRARCADPDLYLLVIGTKRHDTPDSWPDGVVLRHDLPHHEVLNCWAFATAGVIPSLWPEPFGLVAVEAMTFGVPVVVSDVGGLPEIVSDGVDGVVVPAGDADAVSTAVLRLLGSGPLRASMGNAARQTAGRYTAEVVVTQNLDAYRAVARKPVSCGDVR